VRIKSVLLGFAASGALVLSTVAVTLPASAAPVTSSHVSISASPRGASPASSTGQQICTSNGVICLQRITSVANGSAYVDVWADTITWSGWLEMSGPDGLVSNYPANGVKTFVRGGPGREWDLPVGSYTVRAWQNRSSPAQIAIINFAVNNG
jgi:hypothetical protein